MSDSLSPLLQQRDSILRAIISLGDFRSGSIAPTSGKCGKKNCRCHRPDDPGPGPNYRLTRKQDGNQVSDLTVQAAIQQAKNQLTGAAAIAGPTQVSNVKSLTGASQTTVVNSTQVTTDVGIENTIGPTTTLIGDRGLCTGLTGTAPARLPTECPRGTPFNVLAGTSNVNLNSNTQSDIFQTVTTTSIYQMAQTYELNGTAQPPPPATPAPPSLWLSLAGLAASGIYYMKRKRTLNTP